MNFSDEYSQFTEFRKDTTRSVPLVPYNWSSAPQSHPLKYMPYFNMLDEHAREIANSINQFSTFLLDLRAWNSLLETKNTADEKLGLLVEFIEPIATLALNLPYVIRSRFIYSTAHLCHQANKAIVSGWKDDFPMDNEVYFETADLHGGTWRSYKKLKLALESIANGKFVEETQDFRNKYNHRYSPRIEIGLSDFVTRKKNATGRVTYSIGSTEPLRLVKVIGALEAQGGKIQKAFSAYQRLTEDQVSKLK
jgi:hypothetical protein